VSAKNQLERTEKWLSIVSSCLNIGIIVFIAVVIMSNWSDISKFSLGFFTIEKATARAQKAADEIEEIKLQAQSIQRKNEELFQFLKIASAANFGDKKAFVTLAKWAKDTEYTFHTQADKAYRSILLDRNYDIIVADMGPPRNKNLNLEINNFSDAIGKYEKVEESLKPKYVGLICRNKKLSKYDKMAFSVYVIKKSDGDLGPVEIAGKCFVNMSGLDVPRLDIDPMLDWWEKNKATIKDK